MDEKEIEEIEELLRASAAKIDPGSFKDRYKQIKHSLTPRARQRRWARFWRIFTPFISSLCTAAVVLAIVLPITLGGKKPFPGSEEGYFNSNIVTWNVDEPTFFVRLEDAGIDFNGIKSVEARNFNLLVPVSSVSKPNGVVDYDKLLIVGGEAEYCDNDDDPTQLITVKVYHKSLERESNFEMEMNMVYVKNNANMKYGYETFEYTEDVLAYEYNAFGKYKDTTYAIEYLTLNQDMVNIFDELFTETI